MSANGSSLRDRYGEWALVTGASAGIGLAFAQAFARQGLSCVLAARREERLKALGSELSEMHGVETRSVAVDLASPEGADRLPDLRGRQPPCRPKDSIQDLARSLLPWRRIPVP